MTDDIRIDPGVARRVQDRQRRLLATLLAIMLGLLVLNLVLAYVFYGNLIWNLRLLAPSLLGVAGSVVALGLLARGRFLLPSWIAIVSFLVADSWEFIRNGLLGNETSLLMFIVPMILAGLLLRRVAIYLVMGYTLAVVLAVHISEVLALDQGIQAIFSVVLFAMIMVLLALFFDRFGSALREALVGQAAISVENARLFQEASTLNETLEQRVQERTAELQAVNEELEAFSYSVSHDLRTPLRGIDGFSQALLEDFGGKLGGQGEEYLNRIRGATIRMSDLIDDLLALARISRLEISPQELDLSAMATEVLADLREQWGERGVEVGIAEGLKARGDASLLRIALANLLSNALKFSAGRPGACVEVGWSDEEQAFVVRDNGAGFDMSYADKLFVPFQRLHSPGLFEGTGIGLATTQRIIERHGGQIHAEGEVGKGAAFYFTLPAA